MAETGEVGRHVLLAGHAEPALIETTRNAFADAGNQVREPTDARLADGVVPEVIVVFARRPSPAPLLERDDDRVAEEIERQLLAPQRLAIAGARAMARARGGSIVIVGSVDAFHAYPGRSLSGVAMGGLLGLVRAIAVELAGRAIRANLVVAGPLGDEDGDPPPGASNAALERTLLRSPSHRLARPSEVAAAIRFVAGDDAGFMTGQTLRVDGGWASLNQAPEGMRFR